MLLPQSLLMSLLASYKKEAFGQGAAHRPGRAQGLSRHHGRPLRVGTRRAGAVGGVADARAPPRGSGSQHLGPAPPHARRLGLPGLSGSGHRELRVRGWGIELSPRSFPTLTCDVLRTCKLGIGNGGPTDRHARPRVASVRRARGIWQPRRVTHPAGLQGAVRRRDGTPPWRRPQADRTHPAGSPRSPSGNSSGGGP